MGKLGQVKAGAKEIWARNKARSVKLLLLVGVLAGAILGSGMLLTGLKNNLLAAAGQETDGAVIAQALIWAGVDSGDERKFAEGEFEEMVRQNGGEILGEKQMIVKDQVYYYNYARPELLEKMGVKIEADLMEKAAQEGKVPVVATKDLEKRSALGEEFMIVGRTAPQGERLEGLRKDYGVLHEILKMIDFSGDTTMMIVGEGEAAEKFLAESELEEKYETPIVKFENVEAALAFMTQGDLLYSWTDWDNEGPIIFEELFTNQVDIAFTMGLLEAGWMMVSWLGVGLIVLIVVIDVVVMARREEKRAKETKGQIWAKYTLYLEGVMLGALALALVISLGVALAVTAMKGEILAAGLAEYYGWTVPVRLMAGWNWGMTGVVVVLLGLMPVCGAVGKEVG